MNSAWADTAEGRLHYVRGGSGDPVLLLHGNGHSSHEFDEVAPRLARSHDVIVWDMPGHGKSDDGGGSRSIEEYSAAVAGLIAAIGVGPVDIVGTSVGAFIALATAASYPSIVRKLVMIEPQYRTREWWDTSWPIVQATFGNEHQSRAEIVARLNVAISPELVEQWNDDRTRAGSETMLAVMGAIRDFDFRGALMASCAPAMVVFGDRGPAIQCQADLQRLLPDGTYVVLEGCGHFTSLDQPGDLVHELGAYFATPAGVGVIADREVCIGSENCVRVASQVFDIDADGRVTMRSGRRPIAEHIASAAVDGCPVNALRIEVTVQ